MSEGAVDTSTEPVEASLPDPGVTVTAPEPDPSSEPASWRDGLSDDLRGHPSLQKFNSFEDVAKGYAAQSELVGRKGVLLPKEGDLEDYDRFYSELGRPDSAEDYDLGDFVPAEGLPWSDDVQSSMMTAMHDAGLTNAQVNDVIRSYAESQSQQFASLTDSIRQANAATEQELRTEYGNSYDAKIDLANRAFSLAAGDKLDEIRSLVMGDGTRLGNNPALIRMFARLGKSLGEDSLRGDGARQSFTKSPDQAQAELAALTNDDGFQKKLMNPQHSEHQRAVDQRAALYEQAYPEPAIPE